MLSPNTKAATKQSVGASLGSSSSLSRSSLLKRKRDQSNDNAVDGRGNDNAVVDWREVDNRLPASSFKAQNEGRVVRVSRVNNVLRSVEAAAKASSGFTIFAIAQSDALQLHNTLETERALAYVKANKRDEQIEGKLNDYKFRIAVLKELVKKPFVHTMQHGNYPESEVRLPALVNCVISNKQKKDMVEALLDKETTIWENSGVINKPYVRNPPALLDRNRFRSTRRELWQTAATRLQNERLELYSTTKQHASTVASIPNARSTSFEPRNNPTTAASKRAKEGGAKDATKIKAQLETWQQIFSETSKKLQSTPFLNRDYRTSRLVTDCPVLMEAQQSAGRQCISSNRNPTCTEVGLFPILEKDNITPLGEDNEEVLHNYIEYLSSMEQEGKHVLGPFFCHKHEAIGTTLHFLPDCEPGHFFLYQGTCTFAGDLYDPLNPTSNEDRDDLFQVLYHRSREATMNVVINPAEYSNFARYAGGVSPNSLDAANSIAFTVRCGAYYHILIVVVKSCKGGDAVQYYYRGLKDQSTYTKIPWVSPPKCNTS